MPSRTSLNRDRGLPSNQVHRLDQDAGGRLWLAGPAGLSCYDGHRVRSFDRSNGLECAGLRSLRVSDDTVWVGTDLGLEALTLDAEPVRWQERLPWVYGLVEAIEPCAGGVWLATAQGLLRLEDDRAASRLRLGAYHGTAGFVSGLARVDATTVLAASARLGLVELAGDELRQFGVAALPPATAIACVALGVAGEVLVGTADGLWILDRAGAPLSVLSGPEDPRGVTALAVAGDHWWIGAGRQLYGYQSESGGRARLLTTTRYDSRINAIFVDLAGNIWVGTDSSGAQRLSCLRDAIQLIDTGHVGAVYSIKPVASSGLRVSGDGFDSTVEFELNRPPLAKLRAELPTTVWDTVPDASGKGTLLATQTGLYLAAEGELPRRFGGGDPLLASPCRVLLWRDADLLVGTLSGLVRVRDDQAEEVLASDGTRLGYVYVMVIDATGCLWIGTLGRGLWRERDGQLESVAGGPLSAQGNLYAVAPSPSGKQFVVIQEERIVLLDGDLEPRLLGVGHPVAGWSALWLDEVTIAVGSSAGLDLMDARTGHSERRINALLGSDAWEFTNNRTLAIGPDGRIYCGLNAGLVAVDLGRLNAFRQPPIPALGELIWRDASPANDGEGRFRLEPGKWSFQAFVYAGWLVDEGQVQFRFRLIGFENEWSELTANPDVRYSSLPPGRYELEAQAVAPLVGYGRPVRLFEIDVAHRWWAGLVVPVAAFYERSVRSSTRNREFLQQRARLEVEIDERTSALEQARVQLGRALQRAEEANRFKSQFLANMSHEIRTPMNAIIGFTELLVAEEREPRKSRWLGLVQTAGRNLLSLINDILDFSKIEAGKLQIEARPFSPRQLAEDLEGLFAMKGQRTGVAFSVDLAPELPSALLGDANRINQVLFNLLGNAFKFTTAGGVTLSIGYRGDVARFMVTDTGKGIAADQQRRIFEAFDQGDLSTAREFGGTGLGLAITRHLVQLMGGEIGLTSTLGQGSTFTVTLPLALAAAESVPVRAPADLELVSAPRLTVAVVVDGTEPERVGASASIWGPFDAIQLSSRSPVVASVLAAMPDLVVLGPLRDGGELLALNDAFRRTPRTAAMPLLIALSPVDAAGGPVVAAIDLVPGAVTDGELARRARWVSLRAAAPRRVSVVGGGARLSSVLKSAFPQAELATFATARAALDGDGASCDLAALDDAMWDSDADVDRLLGDLLGAGSPAAVPPALLIVCGRGLPTVLDVVARAAARIAPPVPDDRLGRQLTVAAGVARERERSGAAMVRRWLDAHRSSKLRKLIVDNLANRMLGEVRRLETAVLGGALAEVGRIAHGMKSWSGTYKMTEVYEAVIAIEQAASNPTPEVDRLHDLCFDLARQLQTIPRSYWTPAEPSSQPRPAGASASFEVLVADDNEMNRLLAVAIIEELGIHADTASNGELALECLRSKRYDVVLLDMEMPVLDGWKTVAAIRADEHLAGLHVIAFTAHAMTGQAEACVGAGCDDYLSKPVEPELLSARLRARMRMADGAAGPAG